MNEEELAAREMAIIDKELSLAEEKLRDRVLKAAEQLPFIDPSDCYKLADLNSIDETEESANDVARRVLHENPFLAGPVQAPPSPGEPGPRRPFHSKPSSDELFAQMLRSAPARAGGSTPRGGR